MAPMARDGDDHSATCTICTPSRAMAVNGSCSVTSIAANSAAIVPAGSVIPA